MNPRVRRAVFLVGGAVLGVLLLWGFDAVPHSPAPAALFSRIAGPERHTTDVVTAVGEDYRGLDTFMAAFVFFTAVIGVALTLRPLDRERPGHLTDYATGRAVPPTSDAVRVLGLGLTPPTVLFGIYMVTHGHLSPGGGFQGGVILATGVLLIYLAGEFEDLHGLYSDTTLQWGAAGGAAGYVAVGLLGMAAGGAFLDNVLPLGRAGHLVSAGTVPLTNLSAGVEVAVGVVLLLTQFLRQTIVLRNNP
jgi:multicomponent Na+:H+ antiporter subunit B